MVSTIQPIRWKEAPAEIGEGGGCPMTAAWELYSTGAASGSRPILPTRPREHASSSDDVHDDSGLGVRSNFTGRRGAKRALKVNPVDSNQRASSLRIDHKSN